MHILFSFLMVYTFTLSYTNSFILLIGTLSWGIQSLDAVTIVGAAHDGTQLQEQSLNNQIFDNVPIDGEHDGEHTHGNASVSQLWYHRMCILHHDHFQVFGCLTNEYLMDMFS